MMKTKCFDRSKLPSKIFLTHYIFPPPHMLFIIHVYGIGHIKLWPISNLFRGEVEELDLILMWVLWNISEPWEIPGHQQDRDYNIAIQKLCPEIGIWSLKELPSSCSTFGLWTQNKARTVLTWLRNSPWGQLSPSQALSFLCPHTHHSCLAS